MNVRIMRKGIYSVVIPSLLAVSLFVIALFFVILPIFQETIMERKKEMIRELIHTEWNILALLEQQERNGKLTREEAQAFAQEEIRNQHYGSDGKGYFWIHDMSPAMVVHPYRPDLNGQDLTEYQDQEGNFLFVDMVETVKKQGEGYISYMWQLKDDPTRIVPKISYVRGFEPWGWVVGTGVYVEDVNLEIKALSKKLIVISGCILGVVSLLSLFIMRQGLITEAKRSKAEKALQDYRDSLEELIDVRTAELTKVNGLMKKEIAEREFVEEIIKNSHAELDQIFNSVDTGMLVIDLDFNVIRANKMFLDLVGLNQENIIGTKCYATLCGLYCQTPSCPLNRIAHGEDLIEIEIEIARENHTSSCILSATPYRDSGGKAVGVIEIFKDITGRKKTEVALLESEKRYRTVFEAANDAIFTMKDGHFVECNPKTLEMFGCVEADFLGKTPADFSLELQPDGKESAGTVREKMDLALSGQPQMFEWRHVRPDGVIFDAEISLSCLELSRQMFLQGIARDITQRKKMEKELFKAHKLESIGVLAGGIAHDFNNLLTAILGNVSLAKAYLSADHKIYAWLERTEKATSQAGRLTHQLLTFAKGGAPVKKTVVVADLIEDAIQFSLSGSHHKCESCIPKSIWAITVDDGQVRQVLQNLIINATQAMPLGGALTISARNQVVEKSLGLPLKEGRYARITVEDQGLGIKQEEIEKIFDPFYSTKEKGSGLGLAVSHSIIAKHEGLITVESQVGVGTKFHIFLPAANEVIIRDKKKKNVLVHGTGKILVMDDESYIRELASSMLSKLGYVFELAKDGQEALELYKKACMEGQPFNLVIMDLTIKGGMGGEETISKLLAFDPSAQAIVSSGYSNDTIMKNYREYGFCGVMPKPYMISELSQVLERLLSGQA